MGIKTAALAAALSATVLAGTVRAQEPGIGWYPPLVDQWNPIIVPPPIVDPDGATPAGEGAGQPATVGEAQRALDAGRAAEAEAILRSLADQGDLEAQLTLADLYYRGEAGVRRSYEDAFELYRRAAEAGDLEAMGMISFMHFYGLGTLRDQRQAEVWEQRLVEAGDANGMNNLAYTYASEGRNLEGALALIREAVAVEPENAHYLDTLGFVLYRIGRYGEAIPPLCRAVQLLPQHPEMRLHLGDAYARVGDKVNSRHQWQIGREIFDDRAARADRVAGPVLDSEGGGEMRLELESRLTNGLSGGGAPPLAGDGVKGIEAAYLDECQVPST